MSKRRLLVTMLIFILVIALVVGSSYLVSLWLKKNDKDNTVNSPTTSMYSLYTAEIGKY